MRAAGARLCRSLIVTVAATAVVMVATPSHAATGDEALAALDAAVRATSTAAAGGIDVVQTSTVRSRTSLTDWTPRIFATVPAGTKLRIHTTASADGSGYTSVRYQPSGRLLAAGGIDPSTRDSWATLLLLFPKDRATARRAGLSDRTAIIGIAPDDTLDGGISSEPRRTALDLLFPPYATAGDEGWSDIETLPQADGTTIIRGSVRAGVPASDGEDRCTRPIVEVTVGADGIIRASRWQQACSGTGTASFRSTATFGPQVPQPPTRPRAPASALR